MKQRYLHHLPRARVLRLAEEVAAQSGGMATKTLADNSGVSVQLLALQAGQALAPHEAGGDALAQVLKGCGGFTVGGLRHRVCAGEALVLPAGVPHAVRAEEDFTMLLTVVKPTVQNP